MGWASGGEIAAAVIEAVRKNVKDRKTRTKIYVPIICALNNGDWDTHGEVQGDDPAFDDALRETGDFYGDDEEGD